jgi:hypothetical protein
MAPVGCGAPVAVTVMVSTYFAGRFLFGGTAN